MAPLFKNNTGKLDRIIRILIGALLVGHAFTGLQTPVDLILIVTGLFGTRPLYSLAGINTKTLGEKVGLKQKSKPMAPSGAIFIRIMTVAISPYTDHPG